MASKKTPSYIPQAVGPKGASSATTKDWDNTIKDTRRIKDVESARSIYNRFVNDNSLRSSTIAQTRNQLEGGRPWDPGVMEQNGEGWMCNVNFGVARAMRDRILLPYWKAINDVPHKAAFTIDTNAPQREVYQASYAEAFDEFLYDWSADYDIQFRNLISNMIDYGPGIGQWCDEDSPRYKSVNVQRIYFPKNTRMSPEDWEVVALVRDVPPNELYGYIRDKKTAERSEAAGWNRKAIEDVLVYSANNGTGGAMPNYQDYTVVQDMLVNNDIAVTTPFSPITCIWLYVKEWSGKVGCYVFTWSSGTDQFLYRDPEAAEKFSHLLGPIWYDTGVDSMVHSIKGYSIKNFNYAALDNRLRGRMIDAATISMSMNFRYTQGNTPDETPTLENNGQFNVFPDGLEQLSVYPQIQQASVVLNDLQQQQAENNSQYRQNQQQIAESDTATQANILANQQAQIGEASMSSFLSQYGDSILREQVRRLRKKGSADEDAKKFQKRLKDRGVPDEIIYDTELRVRTGANAALANPAVRAQVFEKLLALSKMPGVRARPIVEDLFANLAGARSIERYMDPEGTEGDIPQRRQAQMENVDFGQGVPLQVAPTDNHFAHVQEHLKPLAGIVQQYEQTQQVSPEQATALAIGIEHTGMHMTYLSQDETMKNEFQSLKGDFSLISSMARGILTQLQKAQQQGPQMMTG